MRTVFLLLLFICFGSSQAPSLEGKWISRDDKNWTLTISKTTFCENYQGEESCESYVRSGTSCDTTYTKLQELDFIALSDGRCFEITGLTKSTLAYRHTVSGRLHVL